MSERVFERANHLSIWDGVVGQATAVGQLQRAAHAPVHAYLLVGPPGSTKDEAARAFAAALLSEGDDPAARDARLALAGEHPDVHEVERTGPAISFDQAREIVRLAALAPVEGTRKVMVLHEFHLLRPEGAALLLKTIEEPPESTIFVILADLVPTELVTISSRCVRVEFRALADDVLADRLRAEGVADADIAEVVAAAAGDLTRARVLASDPALAQWRRDFAQLPFRLDGSGGVVMSAVDHLLGMIEAASQPLVDRQIADAAELDARIERFGERGSGRKMLEERHKRELRRHRTDELRHGLAVVAASYRDALVAGSTLDPDAVVEAIRRVYRAIEALERNPNEPLLLQSLLWSLPALAARHDR